MATVSRDLTFKQPLLLASGKTMTALEIQHCLAEAVSEALDRGCPASDVPDVHTFVRHWRETLQHIATQSPLLVRRLDWCIRREMIRRVEANGASNDSLRSLADFKYGEFDGPFERLERAGAIDRLEDFLPDVSPQQALPVPRDRARAQLIRRFGSALTDVDWHYVVVEDLRGHEWEIALEDPRSGHAILQIASDKCLPSDCLRALKSQGFARRAAPRPALIVVVPNPEQEDEKNGKSSQHAKHSGTAHT